MTPGEIGVSYRRVAAVLVWTPALVHKVMENLHTLFGQQLRGHHSELHVIISLNYFLKFTSGSGSDRCSEGAMRILGEEFQHVVYAY